MALTELDRSLAENKSRASELITVGPHEVYVTPFEQVIPRALEFRFIEDSVKSRMRQPGPLMNHDIPADTVAVFRHKNYHKLLTHEDEIMLFYYRERALQALADAESGVMPESDARHASRMLKTATDIIATSNLRLVMKMAFSRAQPEVGVEGADLIQEGYLGLNHAIEKFDYKKGWKFSTYATNWIDQATGRAQRELRFGITLSSTADENRNVVERAKRRFAAERGGRLPSRQDLINEGVSEKILDDVETYPRVGLHLDGRIAEDGDTEFYEFFADPYASNFDTSLTDSEYGMELEVYIKTVLDTLYPDPVAQKIFELRSAGVSYPDLTEKLKSEFPLVTVDRDKASRIFHEMSGIIRNELVEGGMIEAKTPKSKIRDRHRKSAAKYLNLPMHVIDEAGLNKPERVIFLAAYGYNPGLVSYPFEVIARKYDYPKEEVQKLHQKAAKKVNAAINKFNSSSQGDTT